MSLVLEIEHLLGVAFAAQSQASHTPDWPPQPDRIFSALVAAWGSRGERPDERAALEWLESQTAPELSASGGFRRSSATVFVPPNDLQTGRVGNRAVMPALRRRQPRRFPAFRPHDPTMRLIWHSAEADGRTLTALNALAIDTPYIGHSASLTRCRFSTGGTASETMHPRRTIYPGRLAELERLYHAGQRPGPGEPDRRPPHEPAVAFKQLHSVFAQRWLVLEHVGGTMPDIRAAALISKALRDTIMCGYKRNGQGDKIPPIVSGHAADRTPLVEPHLAIIPLAFLDGPYANGHVVGFALVPPHASEIFDDTDFQAAVKAVAEWQAENTRRELKLHDFNLTFTLSGEGVLRSLDPAPYVAVARTWATCTPIVLDRHLKTKCAVDQDLEIHEQIARACHNIGLPEPARIKMQDGATKVEDGFAIAAGKHSAIEGAPSAYPSGHAPGWTRWRLPRSLASRPLTHAVLHFDEAVQGPIILGAGRFVGLGLCRAFEEVGRP